MLLAAEANHRIANNLTALSGLVRLKARRVRTAEDMETLLLDVSGRIEMVGRLHRLLAFAKGDRLNAAAYLGEVCDAMSGALGKRISFEFSFDPSIELAPQIGLPLGMLTAELVTNAIKYAHPTGVQLRIRISCLRNEGDSIVFEVEDDGVGFPEAFDIDRDGGFGIQLIRSLAGQMRGNCAWQSDDLGLHFRLTLPAEAETPATNVRGVADR